MNRDLQNRRRRLLLHPMRKIRRMLMLTRAKKSTQDVESLVHIPGAAPHLGVVLRAAPSRPNPRTQRQSRVKRARRRVANKRHIQTLDLVHCLEVIQVVRLRPPRRQKTRAMERERKDVAASPGRTLDHLPDRAAVAILEVDRQVLPKRNVMLENLQRRMAVRPDPLRARIRDHHRGAERNHLRALVPALEAADQDRASQ
mmetsp:Transcript_104940/g.303669  ORF Transcript_104940/g.303669 Transcript_104940/m.303669 type:complete len:200 (-) Transcript_104940:8-607(-)